MAERIIEVDHARRRFWRTVAVEDVSLHVERGEVFGVVGPDGAGKTTLLRMMAAVLDPTRAADVPLGQRLVNALKAGDGGLLRRLDDALHNTSAGHITIGGHDTVRGAEAVKAQLGYMPQQFGLYGDLTVAENLAFVADLFGVKGPERERRMNDLLDFAGLEAFRGRRAQYLSGGMKKKLALACALLHRPDVLLLDEPTTGVDPIARREFWDLLSGLHADGMTTVVSTPYMDEAERCNRVALLYEGRVLACDTPAAIKAQVPGQVLSLTGPDIRAAERALADLPVLLDIQTYGDQLSLIVEGERDATREAIRERLEARGVGLRRLEPAPVRMEEAFIYLVRTAREGAGA